MAKTRWLVVVLVLLVVPNASAGTRPADAVHARGIQAAEWMDRDGTPRVGISGAGVRVLQLLFASPDSHPALAGCVESGASWLGTATQSSDRPGGGVGAYLAGAVCGSTAMPYPGLAPGALVVAAESAHGSSSTAEARTQHQWAIHEQYRPRVLLQMGTSHPRETWVPYAAGADYLVVWGAGLPNQASTDIAYNVDRAGDPRIVSVGEISANGRAVLRGSPAGKMGTPETYPLVMAPSCFLVPAPRLNSHLVHPFTGMSYCEETDAATLREAFLQSYVQAIGPGLAAATVAAIATLMFEVNPWMDAATARELLTQTADPFLNTTDPDGDGRVVPDEFFRQHGRYAGYGRVNASQAVAAAHYMAIHPQASAREAARCATVDTSAADRPVLNRMPDCEAVHTRPDAVDPTILVHPHLANAVAAALALAFAFVLARTLWPHAFAYLLARGRTADPYDHPRRRLIMEAIQEAGGLTAAALGRRLGMRSGVLRYHLHVLTQADRIHALRRQGVPWYFSQAPNPEVLRRRPTIVDEVLGVLRARGASRVVDVARELGRSPDTVRYHLRALARVRRVIRLSAARRYVIAPHDHRRRDEPSPRW